MGFSRDRISSDITSKLQYHWQWKRSVIDGVFGNDEGARWLQFWQTRHRRYMNPTLYSGLLFSPISTLFSQLQGSEVWHNAKANNRHPWFPSKGSPKRRQVGQDQKEGFSDKVQDPMLPIFVHTGCHWCRESRQIDAISASWLATKEHLSVTNPYGHLQNVCDFGASRGVVY